FQAEDGIRDRNVTGVQTCALPISITRTEAYEFQDCAGKRSFTCHNHNAFLTMMEGALSGKTGFTGDAGYCYVGALRRGERTFIRSEERRVGKGGRAGSWRGAAERG